MESHFEPNLVSDLTSELALDRVRTRTVSLVAAATRLQEEANRTTTDLAGHPASSRLRQDRSASPAAEQSAEPTTIRSAGISEAVESLATGVERLNSEVDRVRGSMTRHGAVLRGTDLGDETRELVSLIGPFVRELQIITSDRARYELCSAEQLRGLSDALGSALSGLGDDYSPNPDGRRRLRGRN